MHASLTWLIMHGWAFLPGLLFFALLILPELRWQHRHCAGSLQAPSLWFWVTLEAGFCFGIFPYVLLHVVRPR